MLRALWFGEKASSGHCWWISETALDKVLINKGVHYRINSNESNKWSSGIQPESGVTRKLSTSLAAAICSIKTTTARRQEQIELGWCSIPERKEGMYFRQPKGEPVSGDASLLFAFLVGWSATFLHGERESKWANKPPEVCVVYLTQTFFTYKYSIEKYCIRHNK